MPDKQSANARLPNCYVGEHGGGGRDRTDNHLLAKQVLSQLSYTPAIGSGSRIRTYIGRINSALHCQSAMPELNWSQGQELNLRRSALQADALPTELPWEMVGVEGFEPTMSVKTPILQTGRATNCPVTPKLVPAERFELPTSCLQGRRSSQLKLYGQRRPRT